MNYWIARDYNKQLWLHISKPTKTGYVWTSNKFIQLKTEEFPKVTWENSPQLVELKLK